MRLFLGRLHIFIVEKGLSSTRVGSILVVLSLGLLLGFISFQKDLLHKILLALTIISFLFGFGLIRMGSYKYLYGKSWENKKK